MPEQYTPIDWEELLHSVGPYPLEALNFVREGLNYTVNTIHENPEALYELDRHVSGQQLCLGLREFAIQQYGLLAPSVLSHWHITRTDDFGKIVFAMIDAGVMSKNEDDSLEDFRAVFDFDEAFGREELITRIAHNSGQTPN